MISGDWRVVVGGWSRFGDVINGNSRTKLPVPVGNPLIRWRGSHGRERGKRAVASGGEKSHWQLPRRVNATFVTIVKGNGAVLLST